MSENMTKYAFWPNIFLFKLVTSGNKCHKFGHYKDKCPRQSPICGYCSGDYLSECCTNDKLDISKHKCINCVTKNAPTTNHTAFSPMCAIYIDEQSKLKKSIHYYNTKN